MSECVLDHHRVLLALPGGALRVRERAPRERVERMPGRRAELGVVPEPTGVVEELLRVVGLVGVPGVKRMAVDHVLRYPPPSAPRRRVEPARVVPSRHVGWVEELLPCHRVQPRPGSGVDSATDPAQEPGVVEDRRLHHPRPVVERRMAQDRCDDWPHLVLRGDVQPLERLLGRAVRRVRDEVAPELPDKERRVIRVRHAEPARVAPCESAAVAEDRLVARIVVLRVVAELHRPEVLAPAVPEAGERPSLLADVALGVAVVRAEREELHHLARVVLVRRVLRVVASVQPEQHRGVLRHVEQQFVERAQTVTAEELVLVHHQPLGADAVVRGGEPVVPDQRHPLDKRPRGSHHLVEPPDMVVAPGVERCERTALVVVRPGTDEVLLAGMRQLVDGAFEPETSKRARLTGPRAEAGAPKQTLRFRNAELPVPHGDTWHKKGIGTRSDASDPRTRVPRTRTPARRLGAAASLGEARRSGLSYVMGTDSAKGGATTQRAVASASSVR